MNTELELKHHMLSRHFALLKILFILMFVVQIAACSRTEKWQEEVQLSDGRVIVIERETLREGGGDEWVSNSSLSKPKEQRIKFSLLNGDGKIIEWKSTKKSRHDWPEKPLILDLESMEPAVFSIVGKAGFCNEYSKYVYKSGVWIEQMLPEKFSQLPANLFIGGGVDMPKLVNLPLKQGALKDPGYDQSLKQVGPSQKVCGM